MALRNLVPSLWRKSYLPVRREDDHPFYALQREINQLFDDFFASFRHFTFGDITERFGTFTPSVDVKEDEKEIIFKAEIPGIDEKDLEVTLSDDALTIRGEKKEDKEDKGKNYYTMERTYGTFQRVLPLPAAVDPDHVEATYKNGVLTVRLQKLEPKTKGKKIEIKSA